MFSKVTSVKDLKKEYKKLCLKFHPDVGGSEDVFKKIVSDYERRLEFLNIYGESNDYYHSQENILIIREGLF
jgi:preprotein translocase subunit Sec63